MKKLPVPIRIVKIKSPLVLVCSMLLAISSVFYSCKKEGFAEAETVTANAQVTQRFLSVPPGTDAVVSRIIAEVNNRNNKKEFITGFAEKNGYPVWDKVLAVKSKNRHANNFAGDTPADTVIYIPLVLPDQNVTNGFITAVVNDSISLKYCLSQDYKNYPFDNTASSEGAARFASFLMLLDHEVFGHTEFEISDKRLFNFQSSHPNSQSVKMKFNHLDTTNSTSNNLLSGTTSICWLSQSAASAAGTCTCGPGGCSCWTDPSRAGCCSVSFCIEITVGMDEIPGWPTGGGGGGSTGGTSGGGGGEIPHQYPCIPGPVTGNLLPEGPLPPCPAPGPGTGWVPAPFDKLCSNSLTFREGLNHSFFETNMINLRFTNGSTMNEFSAYYFLPNRMKESTMNTDIPHSPYGITNFPARTALQSIAQDFPDLTISYNSNGGGDIVRIFDATIPPNGVYVYEFSKYAAQRIASTCSNAASSNVILQYGGSCTIPLHFPSQQAYRTQTTSFLKMYFPATGTICRTDPSATSNTSISIYSPTCN